MLHFLREKVLIHYIIHSRRGKKSLRPSCAIVECVLSVNIFNVVSDFISSTSHIYENAELRVLPHATNCNCNV